MASIIQFDYHSTLKESAALSAVKSYVNSSYMSKSLPIQTAEPSDSTEEPAARVYVIPRSIGRVDIESDQGGSRGSRPKSHNGKAMLIVAPDDGNSGIPNTSSYSNAGYLVFSNPQNAGQLKAFAENVGHEVKTGYCTIL
eukprot:scpid95870/ scgid20904/ 